jgi:hypothetical protein
MKVEMGERESSSYAGGERWLQPCLDPVRIRAEKE